MSEKPGPRVSFFGVRGSTPCASDALRRYGGNTSCVVVERDDHRPIILDMGTGLREYGGCVGNGNAIEAAILVTHLHWDHVQGLPFFGPIHNPNSEVEIYGPPFGEQDLRTAFNGMMQPPYFPICCDHLPKGIEFKTSWEDSFVFGDAKVTTRSVPHVGDTNGYRIEIDGYVIAYLPDHQEPIGNAGYVDPGVIELCAEADLVMHDAQFTAGELAARPDWGHCTPSYALEVAVQSGAKTLCMFHHDPWHDDEMVDELLEECREEAKDRGMDSVIAASEGMTLQLGD